MNFKATLATALVFCVTNSIAQFADSTGGKKLESDISSLSDTNQSNNTGITYSEEKGKVVIDPSFESGVFVVEAPVFKISVGGKNWCGKMDMVIGHQWIGTQNAYDQNFYSGAKYCYKAPCTYNSEGFKFNINGESFGESYITQTRCSESTGYCSNHTYSLIGMGATLADKDVCSGTEYTIAGPELSDRKRTSQEYVSYFGSPHYSVVYRLRSN